MNYTIKTKEDYDEFLRRDEIHEYLKKEVRGFGYLYKYGHNYTFIDIEIKPDGWTVGTRNNPAELIFGEDGSLSPIDNLIIDIKTNAVICGVNTLMAIPAILIIGGIVWLLWVK